MKQLPFKDQEDYRKYQLSLRAQIDQSNAAILEAKQIVLAALKEVPQSELSNPHLIQAVADLMALEIDNSLID